MRYLFLVPVILFCGSCQKSLEIAPRQGASILFETDRLVVERRPLNAGDLIATLRRHHSFDAKYVDAAVDLNRHNVFGKEDRDTAYRVYARFCADVAGEWKFDFALDAGIASAILVDGQVIFFSDLDTFAGYGNPISKTVMLNQGWHTLELLAIDNCCGSPIRIMFKRPGKDDLRVMSVADLSCVADGMSKPIKSKKSEPVGKQ